MWPGSWQAVGPFSMELWTLSLASLAHLGFLIAWQPQNNLTAKRMQLTDPRMNQKGEGTSPDLFLFNLFSEEMRQNFTSVLAGTSETQSPKRLRGIDKT